MNHLAVSAVGNSVTMTVLPQVSTQTGKADIAFRPSAPAAFNSPGAVGPVRGTGRVRPLETVVRNFTVAVRVVHGELRRAHTGERLSDVRYTFVNDLGLLVHGIDLRT